MPRGAHRSGSRTCGGEWVSGLTSWVQAICPAVLCAPGQMTLARATPAYVLTADRGPAPWAAHASWWLVFPSTSDHKNSFKKPSLTVSMDTVQSVVTEVFNPGQPPVSKLAPSTRLVSREIKRMPGSVGSSSRPEPTKAHLSVWFKGKCEVWPVSGKRSRCARLYGEPSSTCLSHESWSLPRASWRSGGCC